MAACIMGSFFQGTKEKTPRSSNINCSSTSHLRWSTARQVSFMTRASGNVADATKNLLLSSSTLPFRTSPWLMLPPKDPMVNRFYSLEEKRVIPIKKQTTTSDHEMMDDEPLCIGSSHGWLVYTNRSDCALFLYNPISHRIIKLPSIETLPHEIKPCEPYLFIEKLILSSSPNEEEEDEEHNRCIALCIYGSGRNLGYCRPGHDTAWIPLDVDQFVCRSISIAYSSKDKLFYCFSDDDKQLDCWDLGDPLSPKRKFMVDLVKEKEQKQEQEQELKSITSVETYLIADPWPLSSGDDSLVIIERFVAWGIREDGSPIDFHVACDSYPYKTLFFKVYKLDFKNGVMKYQKHSLNDRVFFIGMNQSFSLYARDFPHLKPNSIYFTDDGTQDIWDATWNSDESTAPYGGHDIGIFNYEDKVFESCYYPCDLKSIKRIMPAPVWFTPNPPPLDNYAFLFHGGSSRGLPT